ncbi:hypothetical protein [Mammaliicoccus lentus]|uniref:hypothetical protein n=1 Tax=Mammaliicoccus lentus TaxID=42858 RepID=UPI001071C793|nr:hypothetical protein [Mammaliicoccus lentus]MBF0793298.1 hypothetical protein [Mammaliicoccus lentus]TFV17805.1 hypothetical protein E4T78_01470 [Mammaliicoccus lentus]
MENYKSTQIELEDNARMIVRTGDTEIEINVRPTEVKLEQEKAEIQKASEFYQNNVINENSEFAKDAMDEYKEWASPRKNENRGLVMTNRCSGKTVQSLLLITSDKNSVLIVPHNSEKSYCQFLLEEFGFDSARIREIMSRIYSASDIKDREIYDSLNRKYSIHVDGIERVMHELGYDFKSFTTDNLLVSGFTHEFNKAEEV